MIRTGTCHLNRKRGFGKRKCLGCASRVEKEACKVSLETVRETVSSAEDLLTDGNGPLEQRFCIFPLDRSYEAQQRDCRGLSP